MKWIIYQTVNTVNKKIYVGVHKTTTDKYDYYIGNGVRTNVPSTYKNSKTPFQYAVNKYGIKSFIRTTLYTFDNEQEAYEKEAEIVNLEFIKREDTYNLILGGRLNTNHANQYKKVYMYDLNGDFVKEFNTVTEANKFLNPKATTGGHIPRNIKKGYITKGYQFSYIKLEKMKVYTKHKIERNKEYKEKLSNSKSKKVGRYNLDGELIEIYDSLKKCRLAGYTNAQAVIENRRKHCKNFIFKYIN